MKKLIIAAAIVFAIGLFYLLIPTAYKTHNHKSVSSGKMVFSNNTMLPTAD